MGKVTLSIILPTVNAPTFKKCLMLLRQRICLPRYELIIVSQAATEEKRKLLSEAEREGARVLYYPEPIGVPKALNQGLKLAHGKYLLLMNDDIYVNEGFITPLIEALRRHGEFGYVSPQVQRTSKDREYYFGGFGEGNLISRELLEKVGYLDESPEFRYICCDGDYYARVIRTGYSPHGVIESHVEHVVGQTIAGDLTPEELEAPMRLLVQRYGTDIMVDQHHLPAYSAKLDKVVCKQRPEVNPEIMRLYGRFLPGKTKNKVSLMHRIEWLRSKVRLEDTILEVGCKDNIIWRDTPFKVTTLDKSVRPEENCFPDVVGEAENLPFEDNHFDIVCESELLEHVDDPQKALREAVRVARKKAIITVPNEFAWPPELKPFENPGHVRFYSKDTFTKELGKVGLDFKVEDIVWGAWAWFSAEIYCNKPKVASSMEWADYQFLTKPDAFLITKQLYEIEQVIGRDVADSLHPTRRFEYPWVYINLQPLSRDDTVLNAGAGYAVFHILISKMVKEVHNVDIDADSVNWLNKVKSKKGFNNVFATLGNLTKMTFPDNYFNEAICISTLEHLAKQKVVDGIDELIRVTKPGGKIAITMDVVLEKTDKQVDLGDFSDIAKKYSLTVPNFPQHMMISRVPPYNFPFAVACILLKKGG